MPGPPRAVESGTGDISGPQPGIRGGPRGLVQSGAARVHQGPTEKKAKPMAYSIESTVRELLGNEATKAILEQYLPGISAHPQIGMASGMPLATVAKFSGGLITDEALQKIQAALQALG